MSCIGRQIFTCFSGEVTRPSAVGTIPLLSLFGSRMLWNSKLVLMKSEEINSGGGEHASLISAAASVSPAQINVNRVSRESRVQHSKVTLHGYLDTSL